MAFGEFDLIETYFTHRLPQRDDVDLGIVTMVQLHVFLKTVN